MKFKQGDFIADTYYMYEVKEVKDDCYLLRLLRAPARRHNLIGQECWAKESMLAPSLSKVVGWKMDDALYVMKARGYDN